MSVSASGSQAGSASQPGVQGFKQSTFSRPPCQYCGNYHSGQCHKATGACFGCGQTGHLKKECPYSKGAFDSGFARPAVPAPSHSALSSGASQGPSGRGSGRGTGGRGRGSRGVSRG